MKQNIVLCEGKVVKTIDKNSKNIGVLMKREILYILLD